MNDARSRLRSLLPHLEIASDMARLDAPEGELRMAIMSKNADGSGKIGASFELEPFIKDLLELLGYENMNALLADDDEEANEKASDG